MAEEILEQEATSMHSQGRHAWKRLKKNKPAVVGMFVIVLSVVIALLGYLITPDSTPNANDMILQIGTKPPGFSIDILKVKKNKEQQEQNFIETMLFGKENPYSLIPITGYRFKEDKIIVQEYIGGEGGGNEISYNLANVTHPLSIKNQQIQRIDNKVRFITYDGKQKSASIEELQEQIKEELLTSRLYLFGTDKFGRDILSRLMIGVRVSLSVGFIAVLISLFIGITFGAIAGFFRGRVDDVIMWFINVIWSIPTLLLVFAITLALGKGFWQIFVAVGLTMWVEVARIIRGQVMSIREIEFIEAARALGFKSTRIIILHVLPNVMGPVMVIAAANFAAAILIEAGLSFLGIGVQPPTPSWGTMIKEHYGFIIANDPFLAIIPGVAIMLMVLAFNLLGNGFRDALDVKTKLNY